MNEMPKPTRLLLIVSGLVIFLSLFLVAVSIAALIAAWDPLSLVAAAVMFPAPLVLAVQQYRGTFRGVRSAASASSLMLYVFGAFAIFAFATTFGEFAAAGARIPWSLLSPMLIVALLTLYGGWLNWNWQRTLPDFLTDNSWQFSLREILVAISAICFLTAVASSLVRSAPPKYAEDVKADEAPFGLPDDATKVSSCQGIRGTIAYEFSVCESSFS